ncbi:MAG: PD40 domain-containing protein, partial [Anaerolineales bacterium]|nr:PD40 domain-containing protein [Anaerolineales bacterium]
MSTLSRLIFALVIIAFMTVGCQTSATPTIIPAANTPISPTSTPIPATNTLVSPTNTPIPATATPAPTTSATATPPLGDNGTGLIAFLSDRDGKPAIFVMNADGSNQRWLAGGKPRDTCLRPVWSPDGQRIAYIVVPNGLSGDRHGPLEVWSAGLDGAASIELSVGVTETLLAYPWIDPTWSPDGTRLAVAAVHPVAGTSDKRSVVTILRSDGSGVEQAFPLDWIAGAVEWASNGEQILIEDMSPDESVRAHNVYVLSLSNGEIREVYRDLISAAWSPDGTEIVVVSAQSEQVLIVKLDGTSRPVGPLPADTTPELAVWSPDGITIAVFGKTKNGEEASLYLVTVSTGQIRRVALVAEYLEGLEYSPDGKQLLISTTHTGHSSYSNRWPNSTLWVYDLASNTLTALTDGKGFDAAGTWSPAPTTSTAPAVSASGEIAFASDLDGDFEI